MLRIVLLSLIIATSYTLNASAQEGQAPATQSPTVIQRTGKEKAIIDPATYPHFSNFNTDGADGAACETYLSKYFKDGGLSLAPIYERTKMGIAGPGGTYRGEYLPVEDLKIENLMIPEEYRTSGKIMVTWTLRIEGKPLGYKITPNLCQRWYGTAEIAFPSSSVKSALFVNGKMVGNDIIMEVPGGSNTVIEVRPPPAPPSTTPLSGSTGSSSQSVSPSPAPPPPPFTDNSDPTLTGIYVLTRDDFPGRKLPAKIDLIEVRWKNETAFKIVSPKGMRNMIINIVPVTKQR
ncbi:MAG: hypothetical protein WC547_09045 [Candidatus Omnitrophota bacterium]